MPFSLFQVLHLLGSSKYGLIDRDEGGPHKPDFTDKLSPFYGFWEIFQVGSFGIRIEFGSFLVLKNADHWILRILFPFHFKVPLK